MTALADTDDVAVILQRALTAPEEAALSLAIDFATGAIRRYTRQTLTLVDDDPALLWGNWSSVLDLPEHPVTDVGAVEINGTVLVENVDYVWLGKNELLRGGPDRRVRSSLDWGGQHAVVAVTYSHGFDVVPDDLRGLCVGMVRRYALNPLDADVTGETLSRYAYTIRHDVTASAFVLDDMDRQVADFYRAKSW